MTSIFKGPEAGEGVCDFFKERKTCMARRQRRRERKVAGGEELAHMGHGVPSWGLFPLF